MKISPMGRLWLLMGFWVVLAAIWHFSPWGHHLNLATLIGWEERIGRFQWAPLIVPLLYAILSLVAFPHVLLLWATVFAFPPFEAFLYMLAGSLASAFTIYGIGRWLRPDWVEGMGGNRWHTISVQLARHAKKTLMIFHWFPVVPFHVLNVLAGASHIRSRDFFWGTFFGLVPGLIILSLFSHQLFQTIRHPHPLRIAMLGVLVMIGIFSFRYLKRKTMTEGLNEYGVKGES